MYTSSSFIVSVVLCFGCEKKKKKEKTISREKAKGERSEEEEEEGDGRGVDGGDGELERAKLSACPGPLRRYCEEAVHVCV